MSVSDLKKRPFPSSHGSQERSPKDHRRRSHQVGPRHKATQDDAGTGIHHQKDPQSFAREQTRLNQINQIQEAEKMREWVSKEDEFVLQQSKKKATIRVREGRARTIDWLVVTLAVIDGVRDPLEEEEEELDVEVVDPTGVFDGLTLAELQELSRDIETYLTLEQSSRNRTYWRAIKTICNDHIDRNASGLRKIHERSQKAVSADVDRLLGPKTLKELEVLEGQIRSKLRSNDPIDVEYWEQLLHSVGIYKSKAELRALYESIIESRLRALRQNEAAEADLLRQRLSLLLKGPQSTKPGSPSSASLDAVKPTKQHFLHSKDFDPDPMLRLRPEDKSLEIMDEKDFVARIVSSTPLPCHCGTHHRNRRPRGAEFKSWLIFLRNRRKAPVTNKQSCLRMWTTLNMKLRDLRHLLVKISHLQQRHSTSVKLLGESKTTRRFSQARKKSRQSQSLNGQISTGRENLDTSIVFRWDTNGINTTKLTTTMTIHPPRLFKATNSTSSTLI